MLRSSLVVAAALLWPAVVLGAGRSAGEVCANAGYRSGTAAFDTCVARIEGDDPLSGLEQNLEDERVPAKAKPATAIDALVIPEPGKPAVAPIKPPARDVELPAVAGGAFITGVPSGEASAPPPPAAPPPSSPPPSLPGGGGITQPIPPTPPEINTFTVTVPAWTWGGQ